MGILNLYNSHSPVSSCIHSPHRIESNRRDVSPQLDRLDRIQWGFSSAGDTTTFQCSRRMLCQMLPTPEMLKIATEVPRSTIAPSFLSIRNAKHEGLNTHTQSQAKSISTSNYSANSKLASIACSPDPNAQLRICVHPSNSSESRRVCTSWLLDPGCVSTHHTCQTVGGSGSSWCGPCRHVGRWSPLQAARPCTPNNPPIRQRSTYPGIPHTCQHSSLIPVSLGGARRACSCTDRALDSHRSSASHHWYRCAVARSCMCN